MRSVWKLGLWLWSIVSVSKNCPMSSLWNPHIMQMSMHLYIHITRSSGWYKALCCVNINLFLFWQVCNGFGQVSAQQRNLGSLVDQKYVVLIVAHEWVELDRIHYDCAFCGKQQNPYSLIVCQGGMPHKQLCSGGLFFQSWYFQSTPPPPRGSKVGGEIDQHQVTEGWPKGKSILWPKAQSERLPTSCRQTFQRPPTLQHFLG